MQNVKNLTLDEIRSTKCDGNYSYGYFYIFVVFKKKINLGLLQEASPSVVFIKDIELTKVPENSSNEVLLNEDIDAKVEGTGSGFIWDKFGHIVSYNNKLQWGISLFHLILFCLFILFYTYAVFCFKFFRVVILLNKVLLARCCNVMVLSI